MSDRSRSPPPVRERTKSNKQKTGGFKWKQKPSRDEDILDGGDAGKLERGYRNRSPRRDEYRDRDREREPRSARDENGARNDDRNKKETSARSREDGEARRRDEDTILDINSKYGTPKDTGATTTTSSSKQPKKEKKEKKYKTTAPAEPMIIVNINDRLGTKAAIPCLASDSVKAFKAIVAAHIGRQPHEIMIKRQGERPFKDQLTLQDYGVSSGVQLDLELDTGD